MEWTNPNEPAADDAPKEVIIENDGWWPDLPLKDFQKSYVAVADFNEDLCCNHIELAIIWANKQLKAWKLERIATYDNLAAVPAEQVGGKSRLVKLYVHAVSCYAKGILLREFPTIGRKDSAKHEAIEAPDAEAKFLQYADETIADFIGRPRISAVLI